METANGNEINSPETFLKDIFTPLQLEPVEFLSMSEQEQNRILLNLIEFNKNKHKKSQEEINDFASMYNAYSTQQFASSFEFLDIEQLLNSLFSKQLPKYCKPFIQRWNY